MKNSFLILLMILVCSGAVAQKRRDKKKNDTPDTKTEQVAVDTVATAAPAKTEVSKTDSLTKELDKYYGLYVVIKEKVVKMDFDPTKMASIIDSLQAGRNTLALEAASGALLADSIKKLHAVNDSLIRENQGLLYSVNLLRGKPAASISDPKEFIGTWSLVLRKVKVDGQSPRAGLVDISDAPVAKTAVPLEANPITMVNFVDGEMAEFTLLNGEKAKVFYAIQGFNKTKAYYIDFKGTKADIRMYFMNTLVGPRVSFQLPGVEGVYFYGQMVK